MVVYSVYAANYQFSLSPIRSSSKNYEIEPRCLEFRKSSEKDLSILLRTEAAIRAIERKANSSKYTNLWPKAVLEALDDAIMLNRWESALKIFGLLRKQNWYEPKCQTYTMLLMMLGKCKLPNQASILFDTLLSDGLQPTLDVYTALVSAYSANGLLEKAMHIVNEMKSTTDCKPDAFTYSIIIRSCLKLRFFSMIGPILNEMSNLGIQFSNVTYNILIDGYGKVKRFKLMEEWLNEMIESVNCCPDTYTFNSVIGAYGGSGMITEMEKWFDEFQVMGLNPDIMTYNMMIKSNGKCGLYKKMVNVREFMKKRFISPTVVTYNTMIEVYGKAGNVKKMHEMFLEMKDGGLKPNAVTYTSVVSGYSQVEGNMRKVESVLRQVENSDVIVDTSFFNCVMNVYGNGGDVERVMELLKGMRKFGCEPDEVTFAIVRKHGVELV